MSDRPYAIAARLRAVGEHYAGHLLLLAIAAGVIWFGQTDLLKLIPTEVDVEGLKAIGQATATPEAIEAARAISVPGVAVSNALVRKANIHTYIPDRTRLEITTYTAQQGDTVLGIADKFGLKPETIMCGNPILKNNPHFLEPGQTLRIAPVDGVIRDVIEGDTLGGLARVYGVKPEDIIGWAANKIDPDNPQIIAGQVVFAPGGSCGQFSIPLPAGTAAPIGNSGPASTPIPPKTPPVIGSGSGQCPSGYTGGVAGVGAFIWPANSHYISGYDYSGIHPGVDIDGDYGQPAYAADSGVVVFAGWSEWGFGNTIIIDHGNKIWTLYGHLSGIYVGCGQGVYQGNQIGAIGNTGHSQGSHLHFEVYYGPYQTNPWNVLPPP
jgi:murein DD-endopeptidase MepM/ murein hydrolase activator NlpD